MYEWGPRKNRIGTIWSPPLARTFKLNVERAARGKPRPSGIGGVLRDVARTSSLVFSKPVGRRDSNEADLLVIRRALTLWVPMRYGNLIIEGDSSNAIQWAKGLKQPQWKLTIVIREYGHCVSVMRSLMSWSEDQLTKWQTSLQRTGWTQRTRVSSSYDCFGIGDR